MTSSPILFHATARCMAAELRVCRISKPLQAMVPSPDFAGEFVLASGRDRMPLTYTLQAIKQTG